jgi:glycosyltransferase involved in cell wall biosynthesis
MISIVFPCYNEADNLKALHDRLSDVTAGIKDTEFEFIFIDDCSSDDTPAVLQKLRQADNRVEIIRFARNCGSHAALSAGLNSSRGAAAIVMAADLQDPPELIPDLLEKWRDGAKTVWGTRNEREGEGILTRFCSWLYYRIVCQLTDVKFPPAGADIFLADRIVIDQLNDVPEKHSSVFVVLAWLGFSQATVGYTKERRNAGQSKWTLKQKIKLLIDSTMSFSYLPIRYMSILGLLTATTGFIYAAFIVWSFFFIGTAVTGWSSMMVVVLVIGGVQMMMLGILGEYLWRTFDESRRRPRYVIEHATCSRKPRA